MILVKEEIVGLEKDIVHDAINIKSPHKRLRCGKCPNCGKIESMGDEIFIFGPYVEDGSYGVRCCDCGIECYGKTITDAKSNWLKMLQKNNQCQTLNTFNKV